MDLGGNGHVCGDAVQDQLDQRIFPDLLALPGREDAGPAVAEVVLGPLVAGGKLRAGPAVQQQVVHIRQCIEVNQAGHQERLAQVTLTVDGTPVVPADELDGVIPVDDARVLQENVAAGFEAEDVAGGYFRDQRKPFSLVMSSTV